MKEMIIDFLTHKQLLPITNPSWKKFDVNLRSTSSTEDYKIAIDTITSNVPAGIGGVYILTKDDVVLYIGESERNIQYRLKRQIRKIQPRNDKRAIFFKKEQHQGLLSLHYMHLPENLIAIRKSIEDLLIRALEPEYMKWQMKNKLLTLNSSLEKNQLLN